MDNLERFAKETYKQALASKGDITKKMISAFESRTDLCEIKDISSADIGSNGDIVLHGYTYPTPKSGEGTIGIESKVSYENNQLALNDVHLLIYLSTYIARIDESGNLDLELNENIDDRQKLEMLLEDNKYILDVYKSIFKR